MIGTQGVVGLICLFISKKLVTAVSGAAPLVYFISTISVLQSVSLIDSTTIIYSAG